MYATNGTRNGATPQAARTAENGGAVDPAARNHNGDPRPPAPTYSAPALDRAANGSIRALGYASGPGQGRAATRELEAQAELIARSCDERGFELLEVVHEREPANGKALSRPGLSYALERIARGEAGALVVSELSRITRSAAELGLVIQWINRSNARLVAIAQAFDTRRIDGRLAADLLVEVSRWEATRLSERTRNGLEAARRNGRSTGRPAVSDHPALKERILQMRSEGMTLQAIADRFNEEGVPTVRGGAKWRHSSVQAAAGYKRRRPTIPVGPFGTTTAP
jgi:DNA invertase Pin-like site-specific DNA recombinase